MNPTFWSEYKITFCEPTKCIMNYIISKGYVHVNFHNRNFAYNQFNNHFSHDLDKRLIGLKESSDANPNSSTMLYMSETEFNFLNNGLEQISQTDIDNCLASTKQVIMIKRGIIFKKENNEFTITIQKLINEGTVTSQYTFRKHQGFKFCNLDLVRIKNNESEGFIPFTPSIIFIDTSLL